MERHIWMSEHRPRSRGSRFCGSSIPGSKTARSCGSHPKQSSQCVLLLPAGRPLGLAFAANGDLYVAHVPAGLIRIQPDGRSEIVLDSVDNIPIRYADDLDIARDGTVYLSDATTKFDPTRFGGSFMTSRMDLMEHGGHGRLIEYTPNTGRARVVVKGLQFANGVAMTHDDRGVLVVETGSYQMVRWNRDAPNSPPQVVAGPFPGFPDNVTRGLNGRYWVGLVSKRSPILDALSDWPTLRKIAYRLPLWLQPKARSTGFALGFDAQFNLIHVLKGKSQEFGLPSAQRSIKRTHSIAVKSESFVPKRLGVRESALSLNARPPFTWRLAPVMNPASSLARKTALATSEGIPQRPMGIDDRYAAHSRTHQHVAPRESIRVRPY